MSERGCVIDLAPWDFATECISGGFHPTFVIHSVICITFFNFTHSQLNWWRGNESQGAIFLVYFCTLIKTWLQVWSFNCPNIGWFSPRVCDGVGLNRVCVLGLIDPAEQLLPGLTETTSPNSQATAQGSKAPRLLLLQYLQAPRLLLKAVKLSGYCSYNHFVGWDDDPTC